MPKYDRKSLRRSVADKRKGVRSMSDGELKKEVSHIDKLLRSSLPKCLRMRTENILSATTPGRIRALMSQFDYEAYWFELLLDYEKQVLGEAKKRNVV